MTLGEFKLIIDQLPNTPHFPALFMGHGNPMNAIEENTFVAGWRMLGKSLPRPRAILSISAHWLTQGTKVHISEKPKTIHDFFGFPEALYNIDYPCPGAPEFAHVTKDLLSGAGLPALNDTDWGIDHGTWSVLLRMFPSADIPVYQMSIDVTASPEQHYELGQMLRPLRDKGVLIMGSGNIVHNLGKISQERDAGAFDWATTFDMQAKSFIEDHNHAALIGYQKLGSAATLAIPTPDHYWPLLYILGLQQENEELSFPVEGIAHGSISMRSVQIG